MGRIREAGENETLEAIEDADVERLARHAALASGFRAAARRALAFARGYRLEEGAAGGARERACVVQALAWRRAVRDLHAGLPVPGLPGHETAGGPGLARTAAPAPASGTGGTRKTG